MPTKRYGEYTEDLIDRAEEIFLSRNISYAELSRRSKNLLGQKIAVEALKWYGERRKWVDRRSTEASNDKSVSDEIEEIRQLIYQQIVAESKSGLLVTGDDLDEEEVAVILRQAGMNVNVLSISPRGIDSQLVNSYMNLLAKSGINLDAAGSSAKTSLQQVQELVRGEMNE